MGGRSSRLRGEWGRWSGDVDVDGCWCWWSGCAGGMLANWRARAPTRERVDVPVDVALRIREEEEKPAGCWLRIGIYS